MPAVYEELFAITLIDLEAETKYIAFKDSLKRVLVGDDLYGDAEAQEIVQFFDVSLIVTIGDQWEPLNRVLGPTQSLNSRSPQNGAESIVSQYHLCIFG